MSFTTRQTSIVISGLDAFSTTPTAVEEIPEINDEGWDSLAVTYTLRDAALTAERLASLFPIGTRLEGRCWWVVNARPKLVAPGLWLITVNHKGWALAKPLKVRVGASADQQSAQSITIGGALYAKVEVHEPGSTISVSYLVEDVDSMTPAAASNTAKVGTAMEPPVTIAVPPSIWAYLSVFVYHFPNGWVLLSSDQDRLAGTNAALVTDSYKYIRAKTPG